MNFISGKGVMVRRWDEEEEEKVGMILSSNTWAHKQGRVSWEKDRVNWKNGKVSREKDRVS